MNDTRATTARGQASGKVILFGEHAVVYGRPAIAAAIDRGLTVVVTGSDVPVDLADARLSAAVARGMELLDLSGSHLAVRVESALPSGVGLGSSAALSVALIRALARFGDRSIDDAAVCRLAYELEKIFHGFPSGIDNTVATHGGLVWFKKGESPLPVDNGATLPLVIAMGRAPRQTSQAVTGLRERWTRDTQKYDALFDAVEDIVHQASVALRRGDLTALGGLMNANQALLAEIGVSTAELDDLVDVARTNGALGAKLTGGGGGGAIICLCGDDRPRMLSAFARAGWQAFAADIAAGMGRHDTAVVSAAS